MGWTYVTGSTRKDIIDELTRPEKWTDSKGVEVNRICLAKTYKGTPYAGVLYAVIEHQRAGQAGDRFILVALLKYSNYGAPAWGYKDMEESCGPYNYGCPLKYLDMVPEADHPWVRCFRTCVRAYWAHQKEKRAINKEWRAGRLPYEQAKEQAVKARFAYYAKQQEAHKKSDAEYEASQAKKNMAEQVEKLLA